MKRIRLPDDYDEILCDECEIEVPGLSSNIVLISICGCVGISDDDEGEYHTAQRNCCICSGKGISVTKEGQAIINLINYNRERFK